MTVHSCSLAQSLESSPRLVEMLVHISNYKQYTEYRLCGDSGKLDMQLYSKLGTKQTSLDGSQKIGTLER